MPEDRAFPAAGDAFPVEPVAFDPTSAEAEQARARLRAAMMPVSGQAQPITAPAAIAGVRG